MPRWVSTVGVLLGFYAVVMMAAALWMPHEWDWTAFRLLSSRAAAPEFSSQVDIINVVRDSRDYPSFRSRIAAFLNGLVKNEQVPNAVILDVEFDPCRAQPSCGQSWETARDALVASIRKAVRNGAESFPVYAAAEFKTNPQNDTVTGPLDDQDPQIYRALSGAAHTIFTAVEGSDGLFYRRCYTDVPFDDESGQPVGTQSVWSMVDRVLPSFQSTPCDTSHIPVRLGPKFPAKSAPVYTLTAERPFPSDVDFGKHYLIVASLESDLGNGVRSGPELLGWALSNQLEMGSANAANAPYITQPQNAMLLLIAPAFSAFAVLSFMALFYQLKRARLRGLRRHLPWLSAGLAGAIGLGIFAAFEMLMYRAHQIYPQVSLISLGIVVASGLSGLRGFQILSDESNTVDPSPQETYDYDVFISYAHEEGAWVFKHVYTPFHDARLPTGKKLSVFYDTTSIRSGTAWQTKLSLAIDASRFIVPIYSELYFTKPYCRFEIRRAHRKWLREGEHSRCVLPIMRDHPEIDATVDDIQALSIDDHPDLVQQVLTEIVSRLAGELAAKEPS